MDDIKDILIIRFSSFGDVILTTGVIRYLKKHKPELNIDVITFSSFADIFHNFTYIRKLYTPDRNASWKEFSGYLKKLPKYDAIIDLHFKLFRSLKLRRVVAHKKYYRYKRAAMLQRIYVKLHICKKLLQKHVVERYFDAVCAAFPSISKPLLEDLRPYIKRPAVRQNRRSSAGTNTNELLGTNATKTVVLHPSAQKFTRIWPFYDKLATYFLDENINVVVVGSDIKSSVKSATDKGDKAALVSGFKFSSKVQNLMGKTSIKELIKIISQADLLISGDSGPLHLGVALGTPTIGIFGPTTKELGFAPSFNNTEIIENNEISCRPCAVHGSNKCKKKHFACMLTIDPREVLQCAKKMMG